MKIDITGLDKAQLLLALYNKATFNEEAPAGTIGAAKREIEKSIKSEKPYQFQTVDLDAGLRFLEIDISGTEFDSTMYDQCHGKGLSETIIAGLRNLLSKEFKESKDEPKLKKISKSEKLEHKGDLIVETIEDDAELTITDGLLIVKGNVGKNAKINLKAMTAKTPQYISISTTLFSSKSITSRGGHIESVSCLMNLGNKYIGQVNINGRILTNHIVDKISEGNYKITPWKCESATATIDGETYSGREILVNGNTVYVDGIKKTTDVERKVHSTPKIIIEGSVLPGAIIQSDADIEVSGEIGSGSQIRSINSSLTAGKIDERVIVHVRGAINVGDIGNRCDMTSTNYGIKARNVGHSVNIAVRDTVEVESIADSSQISSQQYGIRVNSTIGNDVTIKVRDEINIDAVGVRGRNAVGDRCTLTSSNYGIKIQGNAGDDLTISVRDAIELRDVGKNPKIKSSNYGVTAHNVGPGGSIEARDDIVIKGACYINTLMRSSNGTTKKLGLVKESKSSMEEAKVIQPVLRHEPAGLVAQLAEAKEKKKDSDKELKLNAYSDATRDYVKTFENKNKYSDQIRELKLLPDTFDKTFEGCIDLITSEVVDIPVRLNGQLYNLQTLLNLPEENGMRTDPFNGYSFYLRDIQADRETKAKIENKIKELRHVPSDVMNTQPPGGLRI